MKKKNHHLLLGALLTLVVSGCMFFASAHSVLAITTPTIISPKEGYTLPPDTQLVVTGLVENNTIMYFFVDGQIIGGTRVKNGPKGTASFVFRAKQTWAVGTHTLEAQAVFGGDKSPYTAKQTFIVPKTWPRRTDGVWVPSAQANTPPVAVMIENLAQVRPQSGLASASVVYETLAEGGVPRFLAIFSRNDMVKVGPVRSSRPYFADWAKEYQGAYLHAGGSRDAFEEIGRLRLRSIDALVSKTARYFFRIGKTTSTHNLFTDKKRIAAVQKDFKLDTAKATFEPWKFKDDPALEKRPNEKRKLSIDFKSGVQYIVSYSYDRASNSYARVNGGKPHLDANYPKPTQIKVKNVIVQLTEKEKVLDRQKRIALQITGSGKGWMLQDGKLHQIVWKKAKPDTRTKFYFTNGKEIEFNRGNTWIEVVPKDRPVLYK